MVGCVVLLVVLLGAGFLFLSVDSPTGPSAAGPGSIELGYTLSGGPVEIGEDGTRRATIHVVVTEGYSLKRFDVSREELLVGITRHAARRLADPLSFPSEEGFDLLYELPEVSHEGAVGSPQLRISVNAKASRGLFGVKGVQSDCSHLFWVHADHLERRTP